MHPIYFALYVALAAGCSGSGTGNADDGGGDPSLAANNGPSITITEPTDGASVSGTITIRATARDNNGLDEIQVELNAIRIASLHPDPDTFVPNTDVPVSLDLATMDFRSGALHILLRAVNTVMQTAEQTITVIVDHPITTDCSWTPLVCTTTGDAGCKCTRKCERHTYTMTCSEAGECTCATDNSQTTTTSATCGNNLSLATAFAEGCDYPPNVAPGDPATTACADVPPFSFWVAGGSVARKSCEGHHYGIMCPSSGLCFCKMDGVWTEDVAAADGNNYNSMVRAFSGECGFPALQ